MIRPSEIITAAKGAARSLDKALGVKPRLAVVLGTGWGPLGEGLERIATVAFEDIPGFGSVSTPGHAGTVAAVRTAGGPVIVQDGRLHCYEGYSSLEVTFPVWAYHYMGVESVVLLAAAGGLNPTYTPGDLMVVRDHMFLFGSNPLEGVPETHGRERFILAADFYADSWIEVLTEAVGPEARCEQGVYAYTTGPSFETPTEATLLRLSGADAVGMSTAPEAIAARYLGMRTGAMCCISNILLPVRSGGDTAEQILETVTGTAARLEGFLDRIAGSLDMIG